MTSDHTPEPWRTEHKDVKAHVFAEHIGMDCHVATVFGPNPARVEDIEDIANANAARIVACVNACAGIPTEQVELGAIWKLAQAAQNTLEPLPPAQARGALQVLRDALAPFRAKSNV